MEETDKEGMEEYEEYDLNILPFETRVMEVEALGKVLTEVLYESDLELCLTTLCVLLGFTAAGCKSEAQAPIQRLILNTLNFLFKVKGEADQSDDLH